MNSVAEFILDTVTGLIILALCMAGIINLFGFMLYENSFGFGTLQEKSSSDSAYKVESGDFIGYGKKQYYMLPLVDVENSREIYRYNSNDMYTYSAAAGDNLFNMYSKIRPVLENTENSGDINKIESYLTMNKNGTLKFTKGG